VSPPIEKPPLENAPLESSPLEHQPIENRPLEGSPFERRPLEEALLEIPRIVIGAPSSGAGKTTVVSGLIAALRAKGLVVQPFKCGPDYIDPSYHELAAGRPCRNLDSWMLGDEALLSTFARACRGADIAVIEGVMGLYDGSGWEADRGSTAHIAKLLGSPVLLVVDISGAARSASIPVLGSIHFDPSLAIGGVILNLAGSASHAAGCAAAITSKTAVPVLGWLPRDARLAIPERHLGLVPGPEHGAAALIAKLAEEAARRIDLEAVEALARRAAPRPLHLASEALEPSGSLRPSEPSRPSEPPWTAEPVRATEPPPPTSGTATPDGPRSSNARRAPRPVLAVARDEAFCFYYPENLELLAEAGCDIEFFRPTRGEAPHADATGIYLGGGYPELHARALSENAHFLERLRELHGRDAPIYAECGGFMVLTRSLVDLAGESWPMAGLIPGLVRMHGKLAALGYRHATAARPNLLTDAGESLRAHEFRHSAFEPAAPAAGFDEAWTLRGSRGNDAPWMAGFAHGNLLASYLHVHFGQRPSLARRFVDRLTPSR
jgi:cobyrinic acid a,c-diamide synthase